MDPRLKQRLVGAAVLTALAVIFVPMLFEEPDIGPDPRDFEIPEIPARIEQKSVEPPQSLDPSDLEEFEPKVPESGSGAPQPAQPLARDDAENRSDARSQAEQSLRSWVIQLGSFGKTQNADQLRDRLRKSGYPAYVESVDQAGTTLFRVRVGPELDRKRATDQRDKIEKKFGIKGIVLSVP